MQALVAAAPMAVLVLALLLRISSLKSAGLALAVSLLTVVHYIPASESASLLSVVPGIAVLFLTVASVIVPGLWFVQVASRIGANTAIESWVRNWGFHPNTKIILITTLIAAGLESMTGFGISMVITIPILLSLVDRSRALKLGLLGMLVMPWGTLGLATIVGASIANVSPDALGFSSSLASCLVFPAGAVACAFLADRRTLSIYLVALCVGLLFSAFLTAFNYWLGPSVAGVMASLASLSVVFTVARVNGTFIGLPSRRAYPFGILLVLVVIERLAFFYLPGANELGVSAGGFEFQIFESPGIPLLATIGISGGCSSELANAFRRAIKPVMSVIILLSMSQIMLFTGQMNVLANSTTALISTLGDPSYALIAAFSGYISGSNVSANALLMPTATLLDDSGQITFAAIQNSAAGHAVLASIPIVTLLLGIAGKRRGDFHEERSLLLLGATMAVINSLLVGFSGFVLL